MIVKKKELNEKTFLCHQLKLILFLTQQQQRKKQIEKNSKTCMYTHNTPLEEEQYTGKHGKERFGRCLKWWEFIKLVEVAFSYVYPST